MKRELGGKQNMTRVKKIGIELFIKEMRTKRGKLEQELVKLILKKGKN